MVDARGIGGNGSSSGVGVAGSNGDGSNWGNSNRSSRSDSNRGNSNGGSRASRDDKEVGSRGVGVAGSNSDGGSRASRDDKEVGSRGVAVGDGLVLSSNCLRSQRAAVADSVAVPESSRVPARLRLA